MLDFIGEIIVEVIAYGTYWSMRKVLRYIPIKWNPKVLKFLCVTLSILLWIFILYIGIKVVEIIL